MYVSYLPETSRLALYPPLYFLSPVDRVVTGVWSHIGAGGSDARRHGSLLCDWLRELLRRQSQDLE